MPSPLIATGQFPRRMTPTQANASMRVLRAGKTLRRFTGGGKYGPAIVSLTKLKKHCALYPEWGAEVMRQGRIAAHRIFPSWRSNDYVGCRVTVARCLRASAEGPGRVETFFVSPRNRARWASTRPSEPILCPYRRDPEAAERWFKANDPEEGRALPLLSQFKSLN